MLVTITAEGDPGFWESSVRSAPPAAGRTDARSCGHLAAPAHLDAGHRRAPRERSAVLRPRAGQDLGGAMHSGREPP